MQGSSTQRGHWNSKPWRLAAWLTAAGIMLLPVGVHLTAGPFGWSFGDFLGIGLILIFGAAIFDLAARRSPNLAYLAGAGAALAAGFGLVVVNGAVGLVGSEDEMHNAYFFSVPAIAILGSILAAGRPVPMALTMLAAAVTHIAVSTTLLIDANGVSDGNPQMEVIGLSIFALLWLASAWLFRSAAKQ